jgi:hypothetical protein
MGSRPAEQKVLRQFRPFRQPYLNRLRRWASFGPPSDRRVTGSNVRRHLTTYPPDGNDPVAPIGPVKKLARYSSLLRCPGRGQVTLLLAVGF